MKGRLEHELRIEKNIKKILSGLPQEVTDYYYNISVAREPKTCEEYLRKIRGLITYLKGKDVKQITEQDISRYMFNIRHREIGFNVVDTSFAYQQSVYAAINSFFTYLSKKRIIAENPMDAIERPNKKDNVQRRYLSAEDISKIIAETEKVEALSNKDLRWAKRNRAIMLLFATTGMRETALSEINMDDFNLDKCELTVTDKRHKTHSYKIANKTKVAIIEWIDARRSLLDNKNEDAMFISNQMSRISSDAISDIVGKYSKRALGIKISPHKLRAAFCTILYENTGDIEFVRDVVGHSSTAVTQRYIVKTGEEKAKAAEIMNGLL